MNLNELFPIQQKLDDRILKEKGLKKEDVFKRKIVGLFCELGECTNEGRWFKYWSENTKPNIKKVIGKVEKCQETGITTSTQTIVNPLLEEYADVIHFVIGLANDLGVHEHDYSEVETRDLNDLIIGITNTVTVLSMTPSKGLMRIILNEIIALGYQLGFTEKEVIEAYHAKNKENHERQEVGY